MPGTLQNWEFAPQSPLDVAAHENNIRIVNTSGEPNVTDIFVDTKIKDIIGTPLAVGYTDLKLKTFYETADGLDITMSCVVSGLNVDIFSGDSATLPYVNGMKGKMKYQFSGLSGLAAGTYLGQGRHQILGYDSSNVLTVIDEEFFNITYHKYATGTIHSFPDILHFNHDVGADLPPAKTTTIWNPGGGSWVLTANNKFVLSSTSVDVTIGVDGGGNPTATGTGPREVEIALGAHFSGINTIGDTTDTFNLEYTGSADTDVVVNVHITNDVIPLFFFAVKNFTEPVAQTVVLNAASDYAITGPAWLTATPAFASGELTLDIVPNPTSGMAVDLYQDIIEITYSIGAVVFTKTISVDYDLGNYIQSPYTPGDNAFTLDIKFFNLSSPNTDTYFQVTAEIKAYDFFTNTLKEFTIAQKIVLFQEKSKFNLGQNIHRLMNRFAEVNEAYAQYKTAKLTLVCEEKYISDDTVLYTATSQEIPFVAGLSRGITTLGILDINLKPNRVTKNSFAYINMLIPAGAYELRVFKNTILIDTIVLTEELDTITTQKITFENYTQGDVIEYYLIETGGTIGVDTPKKRYILFPECYYSNAIIWENEFLLQSVLECTGVHDIKSEFEFNSQKIYKDLVEKLEHLSVEKEVKLTINTGWLMKTDIDSIESLMRSQRAWIVNGDDTIEIRPTSKTMINSNSERELIEFTLEFKINRKYNEETYSL